MAKRKSSLSTVVALMSEASQERALNQGSLFHVERIKPDPLQPRKLLTPQLLTAVISKELSPAEGLSKWLSDEQSSQKARDLHRLADTIEQHGLINPITIRQNPHDANNYLIVTGERRYWAHVLLASEGRPVGQGGNSHEASQIGASIVHAETAIRAHQLIENLIREDINVVEKAHGLWALRYELSGLEYDAYRRHTLSDTKLAPWKKVEASAGISRQYRGRIVAVLQLSEQAQSLIEQHNFAEATIRPIIEKLRSHPGLQIQALKQLALWQSESESGRQIVPSLRNYVAKLLEPPSEAEAKQKPKRKAFPRTFRDTLHKTVEVINKADSSEIKDLAASFTSPQEKSLFVDELVQLRESINNILDQMGQ